MGKKKKKNELDRVKIEFLGGSTTDVTGSNIHIGYYCKEENRRKSIICDFGLIQGHGDMITEYKMNKRMLDNVNADTLDYAFISHSHQDHSAHLPYLARNNSKCRVIMNKPTREITYKLLLDGVFIHQRNVRTLQSKKYKVEQFYDEGDVHGVMYRNVDTYSCNEIYDLDSNLSFRLLNNSHVIGATMIELFIKKLSGSVVKIVYTGDIGSPMNKNFQPFLDNTDKVMKANIIITESTYGSSKKCFSKSNAIDERKDMIKTIKRVTKNKGRIIIPSFSFGRSQTLMSMLYEEFKDKDFDIPIIVDSRLTNEINNTYLEILNENDREYWRDILSWKNFKFIKEFKDTEMFATKQDFPCIVISSSGFCENGHIVTWLKSAVERKRDCIMFTGFTGINTPGYYLTNSKYNIVKIDGLEYSKKAQVKSYKTFSSHAQQKDLINMFKDLNNSCSILLHHGNMECRQELKDVATQELMKVNKTNKIHIVDEKNNIFYI